MYHVLMMHREMSFSERDLGLIPSNGVCVCLCGFARNMRPKLNDQCEMSGRTLTLPLRFLSCLFAIIG